MAVPQSNEVGVDDVEPSGAQSGHVLPHDPLGPEGFDDVAHPGPQPPLVVLGKSFPHEGDGLTGKASGDEVDGRSNSAPPPVDSGSYIVMLGGLRPVLGEYFTTERVDLDLADDGHSGAFEPKFEASDSGEQGEDVHATPSSGAAGGDQGMSSGCRGSA